MVLAVSAAPTRRNFLLIGAWATLAGGGLLTARLVGAAIGRGQRSARRLIVAGPLASLAVGGRLAAGEVILLRDERGIAAVSSRCTHLGCQITANARGFECACHGSAFAGDGRVLRGPATNPLPWHRVLLGEDGVLRVDLDEVVPAATRLNPGGEG